MTNALNANESDGDFNGPDLMRFMTVFTSGPSVYYNAHFEYDERNQLVGFEAKDGVTLIKSSHYIRDCFNRRVASVIDQAESGSSVATTYFVCAGQAAWQLARCPELPPHSTVPLTCSCRSVLHTHHAQTLTRSRGQWHDLGGLGHPAWDTGVLSSFQENKCNKVKSLTPWRMIP